mmetsp:Transcript_14851/g.20094  ORF Transcript_14851/g.20094 Transcript_14851/m.20094 type:complete len:198 (+) Transcript_14851:73-666(+)
MKGAVQGAGIVAQLIACICALAVCGGMITFTVYLGMFAIDNPNAEGWYGEVNGVPKMGSAEWMTVNSATAVDDVHGHFVTWFMWGFVNMIGTIAPLMLFCIPCCPPISACFQCSGMAWWIAGMVWRLRQSGSFASGDIMTDANMDSEKWIEQITADGSWYQYESGRFMWIYFMITWVMLAVNCCCCMTVGIVGALCK